MKTIRIILKALLCSVTFLQLSAFSINISPARIKDIQSVAHDNPMAVHNTTPLFSWKMYDVRMGAKQTAYQINRTLKIEHSVTNRIFDDRPAYGKRRG